MNHTGKRQIILDAAVSVLSKKGKKATIAEIAEAAGVNDSIIYHYFQNKTDLLFYAAGESLRRRISDLERQLQGIREPLSRLTKLIWYQLTYHDDEPEYAKYSIFDCRADKAFFQHEGSLPFLEWTRNVNTILKYGIDEGAFEPNIPFSIANSMIMGVLDMENIQVFTGRWTGSAKDDFDDIVNLILPVIMRKETAEPEGLDKRTTIIEAAEKIFFHHGFERATTVEIARSSGVAEGTLYEYFTSKEDILFSALRYRFAQFKRNLERMSAPESPSARLLNFIRWHYMICLENSSFVHTFVSGGIYNEEFYYSSAYESYVDYLGIVDEILNEGKETGYFRPDVNNRIFKNLFNGCFCHLMLRWLNRSPRSYFDSIQIIWRTADLLLQSIELEDRNHMRNSGGLL